MLVFFSFLPEPRQRSAFQEVEMLLVSYLFFFKIFVIKILTDGFGDPSSLIRVLRHVFKSLLITQQYWREEAGFGMSSCFFFFFFSSQKIIQDSPRKRKEKEVPFWLGHSSGIAETWLLVSTFFFFCQ